MIRSSDFFYSCTVFEKTAKLTCHKISALLYRLVPVSSQICPKFDALLVIKCCPFCRMKFFGDPVANFGNHLRTVCKLITADLIATCRRKYEPVENCVRHFCKGSTSCYSNNLYFSVHCTLTSIILFQLWYWCYWLYFLKLCFSFVRWTNFFAVKRETNYFLVKNPKPTSPQMSTVLLVSDLLYIIGDTWRLAGESFVIPFCNLVVACGSPVVYQFFLSYQFIVTELAFVERRNSVLWEAS